MDRLDRELSLEIPHNMNLDTFAAHFFTGNKAEIQLLNDTVKTTITASDHHTNQRSTVIGNQFFQKLGETLFGFSGGSSSTGHSIRVPNSKISPVSNMDILRNHIVIDSSDFGAAASSTSNDLQQQIEYDKFMNEIWIGIVLTLIIISLVFCICSCFLYHQFRQWKRNYRHNLQQTQDIESVKLNPDADDPVPEYTLVSGLPSYEAALELMQKTTTLLPGDNTSSSCLIVYPSLFSAFMVNEKESLAQSPSTVTTSATEATIPQSPSIGGAVTATTLLTTPTTLSQNVKCQNIPRLALHSIPSYEEATGCQPQQQQQHNDTNICLMKSSNWCEDTTKVLLIQKKN